MIVDPKTNTYTLETTENLITTYSVEAEELGTVEVLKAMFFHTGQRRAEEMRNQNPSAPTTKVYVVLKHHGLYIANAVEYGHDNIALTHLEKVESYEGFLKQISREVNRTSEGNRMLLAMWSYV